MALEVLRRVGQRVWQRGTAVPRASRVSQAPRGREESPTWDDPTVCPFCRAALSDGGAAFVDHIDESVSCADRFADWRANVVDDIGGEWSG